MGQLHISKIKFRYPVPDDFSPQKAEYNGQQKKFTDVSTYATADFQVDLFTITLSQALKVIDL